MAALAVVTGNGDDGNGGNGDTFKVTVLVLVTVGDFSGYYDNTLEVTALLAMTMTAIATYSRWRHRHRNGMQFQQWQ